MRKRDGAGMSDLTPEHIKELLARLDEYTNRATAGSSTSLLAWDSYRAISQLQNRIDEMEKEVQYENCT